jgi:hypothetical protein
MSLKLAKNDNRSNVTWSSTIIIPKRMYGMCKSNYDKVLIASYADKK